MRGLRLIALSFILCLHVFAQAPICALSGTVEEPNGKPVAKARVFATGSAYSLWRATDAAGFFCFEQVEPDSYRVSADKAGYLPGKRLLVVENDAKPASIKIQISQSAVISGVVLDSDGDPLSGASVGLWTRVRGTKGFTENNEDSKETGPDGTFRFTELDPGTYYVSARPQDAQRRRASFPFLDAHGEPAREASMNTFYSGAFDFENAAPLTVKAGRQITNLVLTVGKAPARRISGRIAARLSPTASVFIDGEEVGEVVRLRPDGTFRQEGLIPGTYSVRLIDGEKAIAAQRVDLTNGDAEGIVLEPVQTMEVLMTFRTERDGPALRPTPHSVFLLEKGSGAAFGGRPMPDGSLTFKNVAPGFYTCRMSVGSQKLYVKKSCGDLDFRGGGKPSVEVVLSPSVARIEGRVNDASEETTVILVSEPAWVASRATADARGNYTFEAVAPGRYRMFAIQGFDEDQWGSPELAAALAGKSVAVELKENEKRSLSLTVISDDEWDAAVQKIN